MSILAHEKQILEYEKTVNQFKEQSFSRSLLSDDEIQELEVKLEELKNKVYSQLTPWDRVNICRHPQRPQTLDYIKNIAEEFVEIHGDRLFADDTAIVTGFAKIGGEKFVVVGQEKGRDTETRLHHNFGMPHPEGYRKAMRAMRLAEKFKLPILCLLDTPGAYPGLAAEERGQGWAIAQNIQDMARLKTPIIIVVIGEGCSGGALGIGVGDTVGMLEHAYYSVISPEGCSSILFKDASKSADAAKLLKMHAENLFEFGIIDEIIKEPRGGAHHDPQAMHASLKEFVLRKYQEIKELPVEELIEIRYRKFRKIGRLKIAVDQI